MNHVPRILVDRPLVTGERLILPGDKSHHLHTVLRLGQGAPLRLFNGDGGEYRAAIAAASRNTVQVDIGEPAPAERESPLQVTLAQGIVRGDRMDFAIAKAVELGAHIIQPLFCERGSVKLAGTRLHKKQAHWQRVAESAAEQSGRLAWPNVRPALPLTEFLHRQRAARPLILVPHADTRLQELERSTDTTLLVGPESGFSDDEIETAQNAGCIPLRLGPRTLRTETAGMAALAALQSRWGDLG